MKSSGAHLWRRLPVWVRAFTLQAVAFGILLSVAPLLPKVMPPPYPLWGWVLAQAGLALVLSALFGLPRWWLWIQGLFPLFLGLALQYHLLAMGAGAIALVLWLVFKNALTEGVPLYLSNAITQKAMCVAAETLQQPINFCDLGCGWGQMVRYMGANCAPVVRAVGVETAWLSYWVAKWRVGWHGEVYRTDLWAVDLRAFNLVYAFLSPAPMARLEEKVLAEMPPKSLFVSNSFPLPNVPATEIWQLNDRRGTYLYLYRFDEQGALMPPQEVQNETG